MNLKRTNDEINLILDSLNLANTNPKRLTVIQIGKLTEAIKISYYQSYQHGEEKGKCKAAKPVVQSKDGEVIHTYDSVTDAAKKIGVTIAAISQACKKGTTVKGFHWKFE